MANFSDFFSLACVFVCVCVWGGGGGALNLILYLRPKYVSYLNFVPYLRRNSFKRFLPFSGGMGVTQGSGKTAVPYFRDVPFLHVIERNRTAEFWRTQSNLIRLNPRNKTH